MLKDKSGTKFVLGYLALVLIILSGGASAVWAIYQETMEAIRQGRWGVIPFWAYAYLCVIFVSWLIERTNKTKLAEAEKKQADAESKLKPSLRILPTTEQHGSWWLLFVENTSDVACRFGVTLESAKPPIQGLVLPMPLEIANEDAGIAEIAGRKRRGVHILVSAGDSLMVTRPDRSLPIPCIGYELSISAFCENGPTADPREFIFDPLAQAGQPQFYPKPPHT